MNTRRLFAALAAVLFFGFSAVALPSAGPDGPDAAARIAFEVDQAHSQVTFKVRHLGISSVSGGFGSFEARIELDPNDLTTLRTTAVIDAGSIDTGIEKRDNHLRSADFLEAETHPEITFVSKEVRNVDGSTFELVGDLTIRGVTHEIVLDAEMRGPATLMDRERVAFTATGSLDRTAYGLTWNQVVEAGSLLVGEEVDFTIEIEALSPAS